MLKDALLCYNYEMKSPEYSDEASVKTPAISMHIPVKSSGKMFDYSRRVELATLYSAPVVIIEIEENGLIVEERISYTAASRLNPELFEEFTQDLKSKISLARRKASNPNLFIEDLAKTLEITGLKPGAPRIARLGIMFGSPYQIAPNCDMIILKKDEKAFRALQKYTPYLVWCTDSDFSNTWNLYLIGFDDKPVAVANWDDEKALSDIAQSLLDIESNQVIATLNDPDRASLVASLAQGQNALARCPEYKPKKAEEEVRAIIQSSNTILEFPEHRAFMRAEHYPVVSASLLETKIIACNVGLPLNPVFKLEPKVKGTFLERHQEAKREKTARIAFNALSELERETKKEEEQFENRVKWASLFTGEAIKGGWRVVHMPEGDAWTIFITKLTQAEWSILEPAFSLLTVEI